MCIGRKTKSGLFTGRRQLAVEEKLVAAQLRFMIHVYRDICFVRPKKQDFSKK